MAESLSKDFWVVWPKTINIFVYSWAEVKGPPCRGCYSLGLDADGSAALASIKAAGGVTFAQANPIIPDMPRSAVATGNVDLPAKPQGRRRATADRKQNAQSVLTEQPSGD
jgi:chemotaxis response regulator CheB